MSPLGRALPLPAHIEVPDFGQPGGVSVIAMPGRADQVKRAGRLSVTLRSR